MPDTDTSGHPTARRTVLAGTGLVAGAALASSLDGSAYAASRHPGPHLLSTQARHLVGRFSYGVTPALARQVRAQGGAQQWFDRQLHPSRVHDAAGDALHSWFPHLKWSPAKVAAENDSGAVGGWEVMSDYQNSLLLRRMKSQRQVLETMAEFWENHFNVPVSADGVYTWRVRYGNLIRARALSSFESLLQGVSVHPAMGIYLGNAVSDKDHPNENQGRELLELHTVGLAAGYSEKMVVDSARILTGWQVDMWGTWDAGYNELAHSTGKVRVLGFHSKNHSQDGKKVTRDYLHYLAHHPATAQHIAGKLALAFVSDSPSRALVNRLARVYLQHGTQIKPVLSALVASSEFKHSVGDKIRDPENDLVATYRLMNVHVAKPTTDDRAAHQLIWQASSMGMMPMSWPAPQRPAHRRGRMGVAVTGDGLDEHPPVDGRWLVAEPGHPLSRPRPSGCRSRPPGSTTSSTHMSQRILHRRASDSLQKACRQAVGYAAHEPIDKDHPVMQWLFPQLLTTFFDSPDFLRR